MERKAPRYQNRDADRIPTAILISDVHLVEREYQTPCRTDSLWDAQWAKLDFISGLQRKFDCPVLCGGDLFDFWKPSPELISKTIEHLPKQFYTIYGQHDLPQHNFELRRKSGIYALETAGALSVLPNCHWGQIPSLKDSFKIDERTVLVWHKMTYQGKEPWPGCTDPKAAKLLRQYPQYDLILTGDNHKPFTESFEGRWLVNPGSMLRLNADQKEHTPRVYFWYAEDNSINMKYLPISLNVISQEHLTEKKQRDERIDAFIDRLDDNFETSLSFEDNLEEFRQKNKVRSSVMEIVYQSIES